MPLKVNERERPPLIVICGPTACGKTGAAIRMAKKIGGEVVSADSMQVYKFMNIGTAKPTPEEMADVPHHMIDVAYPDEPFSVAVYQAMAEKCLEDVYSRGKMPILVGGTGFYINAVLRGNEFADAGCDQAYRDELYAMAARKGGAFVHGMLKDADPVSYEKIHPNNVKRVVRALEYARLAGEPISAHNARERARGGAYDARVFILHGNREELYARINARVDEMICMGLLKEVESLLAMGYGPKLVSMQGLGYKELAPVVRGETTLAEAVAMLKRSTRRFAKRQVTWFKHQMDGLWVDRESIDEVSI